MTVNFQSVLVRQNEGADDLIQLGKPGLDFLHVRDSRRNLQLQSRDDLLLRRIRYHMARDLVIDVVDLVLIELDLLREVLVSLD